MISVFLCKELFGFHTTQLIYTSIKRNFNHQDITLAFIKVNKLFLHREKRDKSKYDRGDRY